MLPGRHCEVPTGHASDRDAGWRRSGTFSSTSEQVGTAGSRGPRTGARAEVAVGLSVEAKHREGVGTAQVEAYSSSRWGNGFIFQGDPTVAGKA